MLNVSWDLLKENVSAREYREALSEQRQWISQGRDVAANRLLAEMTPVRAYTRVTMERVKYLGTLLAHEPANGRYYNDESEFKANVRGDVVTIEGNAFFGENTCDYEGKGNARAGWVTMEHDDFPDFYLLFTRSGATIFYNTPGMDQGCGRGAGFAGNYVRK